MKETFKKSVVILFAMALPCVAQVPIVQTAHTADPAPMVHDGQVFLYVGHDENTAPDERFVMHEFLCFSTSDMVNWTARGTVLKVKETFKWSAGYANASHVIARNGKYYLYAEVGGGIGVAGPFIDALGRPLVKGSETKARHGHDDLDPCVFVHDDGRAFMYWGNNACYFVELNDDMISRKTDIQTVPLTKESFGPDYEEAPWVYQRNGQYYMLYASAIPESIHYATSKSPAGPWDYAGEVMDVQKTNGSNHPGLIDFKGKSYFFYQTDSLPNGLDKRRSVCVERFEYGPDGKIPKIPRGPGVVEPAGAVDPYQRVEAETMAWGQGVRLGKDDATGVFVTKIDTDDFVKIRSVDFGARTPKTFEASVASEKGSGVIDVRLDSQVGPRIGRVKVKSTGGGDKWATVGGRLGDVRGVHDVYLVFTGDDGDQFNIDWWQVK